MITLKLNKKKGKTLHKADTSKKNNKKTKTKEQKKPEGEKIKQ